MGQSLNIIREFIGIDVKKVKKNTYSCQLKSFDKKKEILFSLEMNEDDSSYDCVFIKTDLHLEFLDEASQDCISFEQGQLPLFFSELLQILLEYMNKTIDI